MLTSRRVNKLYIKRKTQLQLIAALNHQNLPANNLFYIFWEKMKYYDQKVPFKIRQNIDKLGISDFAIFEEFREFLLQKIRF